MKRKNKIKSTVNDLDTHVLLLIHHKATMPYTCALTSYSLISAVHVYTMCTP